MSDELEERPSTSVSIEIKDDPNKEEQEQQQQDEEEDEESDCNKIEPTIIKLRSPTEQQQQQQRQKEDVEEDSYEPETVDVAGVELSDSGVHDDSDAGSAEVKAAPSTTTTASPVPSPPNPGQLTRALAIVANRWDREERKHEAEVARKATILKQRKISTVLKVMNNAQY